MEPSKQLSKMLKNDGSFGAKMERAKEPENTEKMRPGLKGSSKCEYIISITIWKLKIEYFGKVLKFVKRWAK